MAMENSQQWRRLTLVEGLYAEVEADLLVAALQGSGIPALRVPQQQALSALVVGFPGVIPVAVLVPPEALTEAREVLGEQPPARVEEPVHSASRWLVGLWVLLGVTHGVLYAAGVRQPWTGLLAWVELIFAAFFVRALVRLAGRLRAQHRPVADLRVLIATLLFFTVLALAFGVLMLLNAAGVVAADAISAWWH